MDGIQGQASSSARIEAPAALVYSIIADYRQHHPRIVPPKYFKALEVEEGGVGSGTRIRVTIRVLGTTTVVRHLVKEPEPGRVLVESDIEGKSDTFFTVEPLNSDRAAMLTIVTRFKTQRQGILGRIERYLAVSVLSRIYKEELTLINEYARKIRDQKASAPNSARP